MVAIITLIKDLLVATVYQKIGLLRIKDDYRYSNSESDLTDLRGGKPHQWRTHDFSKGFSKVTSKIWSQSILWQINNLVQYHKMESKSHSV